MKYIRRMLAGLVGASIVMSPAYAAPATRSSEAAEESSSLSSGTWIGIIGALLVVALAAIAAFDDNDEPVSP
ncbi:hypothetical protein N0B51_10240 [Tsuneonella sp. YG55]|uniref:Ferrochelatase n=1 Tax=Tsuneonella litorea TaxID=2976475 RepID=A0A9X2W255_9SPHN|nr:hypothetical protein [Tsuneonella litorea]MCT2559357.1 hypothetical protein [Tsuneonella litorea]